METAKADFQFTIFKGNYETLFSRILSTVCEQVSILFPVHSHDYKTDMAFVNHVALETTNPKELYVFTNAKSEFYLLQFNHVSPTQFQFQLYMHYVRNGILLLEITAEELALLVKISKKLYYQDHPEKMNVTRQLYFKVLLQYIDELVNKKSIFLKREAILAQKFLEILAKDKYPDQSVRHYAERLFVSRRYLTKSVHVCFGETPKALIDKQIIAAAKKRLNSSEAIFIIAEELKFDSAASFATFFKKHTGYTASEYRNIISNP